MLYGKQNFCPYKRIKMSEVVISIRTEDNPPQIRTKSQWCIWEMENGSYQTKYNIPRISRVIELLCGYKPKTKGIQIIIKVKNSINR